MSDQNKDVRTEKGSSDTGSGQNAGQDSWNKQGQQGQHGQQGQQPPKKDVQNRDDQNKQQDEQKQKTGTR
jgi:hypothetical protein